jgi:hypothetical protein
MAKLGGLVLQTCGLVPRLRQVVAAALERFTEFTQLALRLRQLGVGGVQLRSGLGLTGGRQGFQPSFALVDFSQSPGMLRLEIPRDPPSLSFGFFLARGEFFALVGQLARQFILAGSSGITLHLGITP